jgi:hypothetical protein
MMKFTGIALVSAAMLCASPIFAGDKKDDAACCAKSASNKHGAMCADFASLGVSAEQKTKLEAWQAECTKAGCTKESKEKFLHQAKGILSADQYAKLKAECDGSKGKKSEA